MDPYSRRILKLPDGGSVALDFEDFEHVQDLPQDAPVVILLPGKIQKQIDRKYCIGVQPSAHFVSGSRITDRVRGGTCRPDRGLA